MGEPAIKYDHEYTYGEYREWPEDERWELIDGVAWNMSPAPNRFHQGILMELAKTIALFLEDRSCRIYPVPFDVLLPDHRDQEEDDVKTVVQPDISVICDESKLTEKGCTGAPDWIIEILSPYTSKKDIAVKLELYERHGVKEYWLVDPGNRYIHVYLLDENGKYPFVPELYLGENPVESTTLKGLRVDLGRLFSV